MSQIPSGVRKDQPGLRYQYLHHTVASKCRVIRECLDGSVGSVSES